MRKHRFDCFLILSLIRKGDSTQLLELKHKRATGKPVLFT